jgi:hypothetical protein
MEDPEATVLPETLTTLSGLEYAPAETVTRLEQALRSPSELACKYNGPAAFALRPVKVTVPATPSPERVPIKFSD